MSGLGTTGGIYPLAPHHLDDLQRIAADARIAATTRLPHPYPPGGARQFFARLERGRTAGTMQVFAIEDRRRLVGVCGLHDITAGHAELGFFVDPAHHGKGHATFAVGLVLAYAFDNLRLTAVWADVLATNAASLRVLDKHGFVRGDERPHDHERWPRDVPLIRHTLTSAQWREHRDGPALVALHPALRTILAAELAAGNAIRDVGRDFPKPGSVLVRLQQPFRALPSPLPDGVTFTAVNDPHWWMGELSAGTPPHLLVH
ncbi:MAG: GNAT family N-acetyltransferase [Planctomycetes bacterium]|nr:GNAT family N-acetyltransferase [Planctomycetota bacterium]